MAPHAIEFRSDYSQEHAGAFLSWFLDARGIKKVDFAKRCGRTSKTISEIISGKAPITPETALQFERVLGESAAYWLQLEATHQLQQVRDRESAATRSNEAKSWARQFPIKAMVDRGVFDARPKAEDLADAVLRFFGVSSISAFQNYWAERVSPIRFKQHQHHKVDDKAVITWLRQGELIADQIPCKRYDEARFRAVLVEARALTLKPWVQIESRLIELCASAGVAVALSPSIPKTGLRGAAYWATKDKAVIVLSDRGKSEEAFWFAFFHEAAHILLHSKKSIFIDHQGGDGNEDQSIEDEADRYSADFLVPEKDVSRFISLHGSSGNALDPEDLQRFAEPLGISPGLLLVRLQFEEIISWNSPLNRSLKSKAEFSVSAPE